MKALSYFRNIFADKEAKPSPELVQTALEPLHEKESNQGGEFLDDFVTMDDEPQEQA
jgi:hypothetical protein